MMGDLYINNINNDIKKLMMVDDVFNLWFILYQKLEYETADIRLMDDGWWDSYNQFVSDTVIDGWWCIK